MSKIFRCQAQICRNPFAFQWLATPSLRKFAISFCRFNAILGPLYESMTQCHSLNAANPACTNVQTGFCVKWIYDPASTGRSGTDQKRVTSNQCVG